MNNVAEIVRGLIEASISGRQTDAEWHFGPRSREYEEAKDEIFGRADYEDSNEERDDGTGNTLDAWGTTEHGQEWRIKIHRIAR